MNESAISLRLTLPSISSKKKPMVIEISSSSSEEETQKNEREGEKRGRKRRYPDVEMKAKEEKRREDEDCCILPFNPFAADLNEKLSVSAAHSQLDDLTIVAERGQVACRDFPHSRHLCAEYPFSKTPHESCCLKCYCYVCDEAAPCKCWKGPKGHCHASDQDESWKSMRKFHRIVMEEHEEEHGQSHKVKTHF